MERNHLTRRGALLAQLEHRCLRPGLWLVEGYQLRRAAGRNGWTVLTPNGDQVWAPDFERALESVTTELEET